VGDQRAVGGALDHHRRGKWIEIPTPADALYQHFLVAAERRFWRCVQPGETPRPYGIEPPRQGIEAVRVVDMSGSNAWAEFANLEKDGNGDGRTASTVDPIKWFDSASIVPP
jgi:hypothetical protein